MSRGPENTFITSVHRHLPTNLYWMKNHNQYNGGIADCWYSGVDSDLWIEFKYFEVPKRPDTAIDLCHPTKFLSMLQQRWLAGRYEEGRTVAVVLGSKQGGVMFLSREWEKPFLAQWYAEHLVDRRSLAKQILDLTGGPL